MASFADIKVRLEGRHAYPPVVLATLRESCCDACTVTGINADHERSCSPNDTTAAAWVSAP